MTSCLLCTTIIDANISKLCESCVINCAGNLNMNISEKSNSMSINKVIIKMLDLLESSKDKKLTASIISDLKSHIINLQSILIESIDVPSIKCMSKDISHMSSKLNEPSRDVSTSSSFAEIAKKISSVQQNISSVANNVIKARVIQSPAPNEFEPNKTVIINGIKSKDLLKSSPNLRRELSKIFNRIKLYKHIPLFLVRLFLVLKQK